MKHTQRTLLATAVALLPIFAGCDALSEPDPAQETGARLIVPTDSRTALQAESPPPAISGGTLLVLSEQFAVAADPARDRVSIIDLQNMSATHIELRPGDEPGRMVQDADGRVHVALRRGGAIVTIDPQQATILDRRPVCGAPRGIAAGDAEPMIDGARVYPGGQLLYVACAGGEVMRLASQGGKAELLTRLAPGLRDVFVGNDGLHVTDFKSATVIALSNDGKELQRMVPATTTGISGGFDEDSEVFDMQPELAWKTVQAPDGIYMLHQRASLGSIPVEGDPAAVQEGDVLQASPYGGGGSGLSCSGIVHTTVTRMRQDRPPTHTGAIMGATLTVDMAVSRQGWIALAIPGAPDLDAPRPFIDFRDDDEEGVFSPSVGPLDIQASSLALMQTGELRSDDPSGDCAFAEPVFVDGQVTAVAFTPAGRLVAQSREPARVFVGDVGNPFGGMALIELDGVSIADTGHELFHRDTGAGIACASCHAEGADDGHVWDFETIGRRRTQAVHVGLEGTAPFHWDGDMDDLSMLMTEVFVGRMGGVHQSRARLGTLKDWVFSLRPAAPVRRFDEDDILVAKGKALFDSAEVGCVSCHSGGQFTNNQSVEVGTGAGHPLQVPSLVGIAYRAPFIHTGCADTLRDRFEPSCGGGDQHGRTSQLDGPELDALVAYLETL